MLTCKYCINLNTEKEYDLETLFGLKKFYYLDLLEADRAIQVYNKIKPSWGRKKNVK